MVSRRSLGYAFLAGAVAWVVVIGVWGVLDMTAQEVMDQPRWENSSRYANTSADEHAAAGQRMLADLWNWGPFVALVAIGFSILLDARTRGGP